MFGHGTKIGRYHIVRPLGRGSPDGLFEVEDEAKNKFALRSPIADLEDSGSDVTTRFAPVADSLRTLMHLNLVPLFDVFVERGQVFLITERVSGRSLQAAKDELAPKKALVILRQILDAVAYAHAQGRVHRDLQPSKILLAPMVGWELVKVADFGLGTLIDEVVLEFGAGALTGTLRKPAAAYMAPEQVRGRSVDERTDIYSLGVMLYELLARQLPFASHDPELVMRSHLSLPPPRLDELFRGAPWCTREVVAIVTTALAKDREHRFGSATEMLQAVDAAYASLQHLSS